jgi:hypothetical protein
MFIIILLVDKGSGAGSVPKITDPDPGGPKLKDLASMLSDPHK